MMNISIITLLFIYVQKEQTHLVHHQQACVQDIYKQVTIIQVARFPTIL